MKRHLSPPLVLAFALAMALSFLGGALAPPLHGAEVSARSAPAITPAQWVSIRAGMELLLIEDDAVPAYLPLILR